MEWMLMPYRRYADFSGRSRRKEYWMFALFQFLVIMAMIILLAATGSFSDIESTTGPGGMFFLIMALGAIFFLGSIVPGIAVAVRRFHDQDKSGWMYLLAFVPYIGGIVVFVFMCIEGTRGPNRFGPDPKDPHYSDVFT